MNPAWVPFIVGALAVAQGGMNRLVASKWGLSAAVFLNTLVFMAASIAFIAATKSRPDWFPPGMAPKVDGFQLWYLLPGLFGFGLVVGIPYAIGHLGAARVFVGIIAAQLFFSMIWDAGVEGIQPNPTRIAGAALALTGAWLVARA